MGCGDSESWGFLEFQLVFCGCLEMGPAVHNLVVRNGWDLCMKTLSVLAEFRSESGMIP